MKMLSISASFILFAYFILVVCPTNSDRKWKAAETPLTQQQNSFFSEQDLKTCDCC